MRAYLLACLRACLSAGVLLTPREPGGTTGLLHSCLAVDRIFF
jgi:hypothetical protein